MKICKIDGYEYYHISELPKFKDLIKKERLTEIEELSSPKYKGSAIIYRSKDKKKILPFFKPEEYD